MASTATIVIFVSRAFRHFMMMMLILHVSISDGEVNLEELGAAILVKFTLQELGWFCVKQ
jgi:hypothetical protein